MAAHGLSKSANLRESAHELGKVFAVARRVI